MLLKVLDMKKLTQDYSVFERNANSSVHTLQAPRTS